MKNLTRLLFLVGVGFFINAGTALAAATWSLDNNGNFTIDRQGGSQFHIYINGGSVMQWSTNTAYNGDSILNPLHNIAPYLPGSNYNLNNVTLSGRYNIEMCEDSNQTYINCTNTISFDWATTTQTISNITGAILPPRSALISAIVPTTGVSTTSPVTIGFTYNSSSDFTPVSYSIKIQNAKQTTSDFLQYVTGTLSGNSGTVRNSITLDDGVYTEHVVIVMSDLTNIDSTNDSTFVVSSTSAAYSDVFFQTLPELAAATSSSDLYGIGKFLTNFLHKVPIGYLTEIADAVTADLNVPANQNAPLLDVDLHSLGIGSTSPMGNILPDIQISTTTMGKYCPSTCHNTFIGLQDMAMWISFMAYLWRRGKSIIHMV